MLFLKENVFSHVTVSGVIRWICVQKANLQLFKNNSPTFNIAFNTKHVKKVNFKWILLSSFFGLGFFEGPCYIAPNKAWYSEQFGCSL